MHPTLHQPELPLRFLRTIECAAAKVGDPDHHLRRKPSGYFQMRVRVMLRDSKANVVGERVIVGLRTRSAEEARARRDLILMTLKKTGQVVSNF